ncbi:hypothetical protein DND01_17465 [Escherichia albertii]|nr:hypothetical protein [Escherichia albertii]EGE0301972.1 hypothetical protein [Escherichia albertii]
MLEISSITLSIIICQHHQIAKTIIFGELMEQGDGSNNNHYAFNFCSEGSAGSGNNIEIIALQRDTYPIEYIWQYGKRNGLLYEGISSGKITGYICDLM